MVAAVASDSSFDVSWVLDGRDGSRGPGATIMPPASDLGSGRLGLRSFSLTNSSTVRLTQRHKSRRAKEANSGAAVSLRPAWGSNGAYDLFGNWQVSLRGLFPCCSDD